MGSRSKADDTFYLHMKITDGEMFCAGGYKGLAKAVSAHTKLTTVNGGIGSFIEVPNLTLSFEEVVVPRRNDYVPLSSHVLKVTIREKEFKKKKRSRVEELKAEEAE